MKKTLLAFALSILILNAHSQIISTIAGTGGYGFSGDNAAATSATMGFPGRVALDDSSNIYFADTYNNRIRKISASTGIITTIAGTGTAGYNGDGGLATSAQLNYPFGLCVDHSGNIYITDTYNHRIRKINGSTKIITTIAGTSVGSYNGDGISATTAQIKSPNSICLASNGDIYFSDQENHRIRKITISTGLISTIAGSGTAGFMGDNGTAIYARLDAPAGIALDANNNLYIVDMNNYRIRKLNMSTGVISTIVGTGNSNYNLDGIAATTANIAPHDICISAAGHLYIVDNGNGRIRKVNITTGIISTIAGDGTFAFGGDNGAATLGKFNAPISIAIDRIGNYYVADYFNKRLRKVTQPLFSGNTITGSQTICNNSTMPTFTGNVPTGCSGTITYTWLMSTTSSSSGYNAIPNSNSQNYTPNSIIQTTWFKRVASTSECNADTSMAITINVSQAVNNNIINKPYTVTRIAGQPNQGFGFSGDGGAAYNSTLSAPHGICVDASGNIYFTDSYNNRVRKISSATGIISTIAGNSSPFYSGDGGLATQATIGYPIGIALDLNENIYIADRNNYRIRKINKTTGIITTVVGIGTSGYSGDGGLATQAKINTPGYIAFDANGNLYFTDYSNYTIRKVNASTGIITTIAGTGTSGNSINGNNAATSNINPTGIAIDKYNNIYYSEKTNNPKIFKIDAITGIISTIAGTGSSGYSGDGGPAVLANISSPGNMYIDKNDQLFISDGNGFVRKVNLKTGIISYVAGGGNNSNPNNSSPSSVEFDIVYDVTGDNSGNLYVVSYYTNQIHRINNLNNDQSICAGQSPAAFNTITPNGGNGSSYTYEWLKSTTSATSGFSSIASSNTLNYSPGTLSQNTWYKRVVSSGSCNPDTSKAIKITILSPVANNSITSSFQIICIGSNPDTIKASLPSGGNGIDYTYTWLSSTTSATTGFSPIASSNSKDFIPPALTQRTWFKRVVSSSNCSFDTTSSVIINVTKPISGNTITSATQNVCIGSTASPLTASIPTGGDSLNYQYTWMISTTGSNAGFTNISNSNTRNYSPGVITKNTWFKRVVSSGACNNDTSMVITINTNLPIENNNINKPATVSRIAGDPNEIYGFSGDGGLAINAKLNSPNGICVDKSNNIYISDTQNHRLRKINSSTGIISTIAGTNTVGYNGDGGLATQASLSFPSGVAIDPNDNIYIADRHNSRIRKIDKSTGIISTAVGIGIGGYTGDGGLATLAKVGYPAYLTFDVSGNLYFSDYSTYTIRKVNASTGIITTIAGTGISGNAIDGNAAISSNLSPYGIAVDKNNNIYFTEQGNIAKIYKIDAITGIISTIAGIGSQGYTGDGGLAILAKLMAPRNIYIDKDDQLFITDGNNGKIRKVNLKTGIISYVAGGGNNSNPNNSSPSSVDFNMVYDLAGDISGNIYVASYMNSQIHKIFNIKNDQTICVGQTASTFTTSTPLGGNGISYTYEWLKSTTSASTGFSPIASSNTANYTPTLLTQSTWFKRVVSSGVCNSDTSQTISVTILNPITNNFITKPTQIICSGSTPDTITASTPTGGNGVDYTYTWLLSTSSATSGYSTIASSNTKNYVPNALTYSAWFRRVVLSGNCAIDTSSPIRIIVTKPIGSNTITSANQTICAGSIAAPIIASIPTGGDSLNFQYTWLVSTTSANAGFAPIGFINTRNYTPNAIAQNTWFKRVVRSGVCAFDTSQAISITVNSPISNNKITTNSQAFCIGSAFPTINATLATGGDGIQIEYQWLSSTINDSTGFSAITSSNTQNHSPNNLTQTTWFRRIASSGVCGIDTSEAINYSINNPILNNTIDNTLQVICSGNVPPTLTASLPSGGNGIEMNYKWLISTSSASSGFKEIQSSNFRNFTPDTIRQNTWFKRVVSSGVCNADTSSPATIFVTNPITNNQILTGSQLLCDGDVPTELMATIPNGGDGIFFLYEWMSSTTSDSIGFTNIASSQSQNYKPDRPAQSTWYKRVAMSGSCKADTSSAVKISIEKSPMQPVISATTPTELVSTPADVYQWYYNNNILLNANNRALIIDKNGSYKVKIDSLNGCSKTSEEFIVSTLGVQENKFNSTINIFPNPALNIIYIKSNNKDELVNKLIEIFDSKGAKIYSSYQHPNNDNQTEINISEFVNGMYFLKINHQAFKFVKL